MEGVICKWGNSAALRLPVAAIRQAAFGLAQKGKLTVTRGRIIIAPLSRVEYDLDALVDGITAKNTHTEFKR